MTPYELNAIMTTIGMSCDIKHTGSPEWSRCFIMKGVLSLGKAVVFRGEITHIKWYYIPDGDITVHDYPVYAANAAMDGYHLEQSEFDKIVIAAINLREQDITAKTTYRGTLPRKKKGHRKAIQGASVHKFIREMIFDLVNQ